MHIYIDDNSDPMREFHLPADFHPELSRTNPFLTGEGSQSIPLTLSASEHNMRLLGFNHRFTATQRPEKKMAVIFSEGTVWLRGTLLVDKTNKREGISCTFYTDEGQFYEKMKDYKLADLDWPEVMGNGPDVQSRVKWWLNHLQDVMTYGYSSLNYFVFAVTTSSVFNVSNQSGMDFNLLLNETNGESAYLLANESRIYYTSSGEDATPYTVPLGYGVTPFLKVSFVLRHIMIYFGYVLDTNIFDVDVSLKRLVILNNTADAIVNGTLSYKQLLPDNLDVEDFINFVRAKFGVEFVKNGNHIKIVTWEEVLHKAPDLDLSPYIVDAPSFTLEDKKAVSLKYTLTNDDVYKTFMLQSDAELTHDSPSGYVEEKIDAKDKTPTFAISKSGYIDKKYQFSVSPKFLHINGVKNLNSELQLSGSAEKPDNEKEEIGVICAFAMSRSQVEDSTYRYYTGTLFSFDTLYQTWGTYSLMANESVWGDILGYDALTLKDNLYNKCYLSRDEMLKKANQLLESDALIPLNLITSMNIETPKIIQGEKVLIEGINYVLGRPDLCKITARTLHPYPE